MQFKLGNLLSNIDKIDNLEFNNEFLNVILRRFKETSKLFNEYNFNNKKKYRLDEAISGNLFKNSKDYDYFSFICKNSIIYVKTLKGYFTKLLMEK